MNSRSSDNTVSLIKLQPPVPIPDTPNAPIGPEATTHVAQIAPNQHATSNWETPAASRDVPANGCIGRTPPVFPPSADPAAKRSSFAYGRGVGVVGSRNMGYARGTANPLRRLWSSSVVVVVAACIGMALFFVILDSINTRQRDAKGCQMSYMRPSYVKFHDFDTEHTRFATKYSLYLYREQGIDDDAKLRGIPILFIPGNAGSYKQVRPIAAEAANHFNDVLQHESASTQSRLQNLDFFTVDFNEDITAFHGQTLLDQAEYLNEAIRYILSLYLDPRVSNRDPGLPDPTSVIILGHSMGGIVARTMLVMPNYQPHSINTIITLSAPHSRPPVTFDGQIVRIYDDINTYWRRAYSQKWASDNPLWHVTLISIAGGSLDTVVPSDYANVESLVPATHGFTVFTSTIPSVWTSMDHQEILWCDQFRKVATRALYGVVDISRASQTMPRAERMRVFRRLFLTGMEDGAEKGLSSRAPSTLLTVANVSSILVAPGERLVLPRLGVTGRGRAFLLPIHQQHPDRPGDGTNGTLTVLTSAPVARAPPGDASSSAKFEKLEILVCSVFAPVQGQHTFQPHSELDFSNGQSNPTRLACKNTCSDMTVLPSSTRERAHPFRGSGAGKNDVPFSYVEYSLEDLSGQQFVAVVDKATLPSNHFVMAEFSKPWETQPGAGAGRRDIMFYGAEWRLPSRRPFVFDLPVPTFESSLFSYHLDVVSKPCQKQDAEIFAPLVRQHIDRPHESKYFVNVSHADIHFHGQAPFLPPPLGDLPETPGAGLSLQFWADPTCESELVIRLTLDVVGSLGRLYMRYRTILAAFPLFVATLVLAEQFLVHDTTGVFLSFSEGLDRCLRRSIPLLLLVLTALSVGAVPDHGWLFGDRGEIASNASVDFHKNDLLMGMTEPTFWFLVPLTGAVAVGICTSLHYAVLGITTTLGVGAGVVQAWQCSTASGPDLKPPSPGFVPSTTQRRLVTTTVLLFLVSTFIPYQFAFLVACMVQVSATARALRIHVETGTEESRNFYHYSHSILLLMLLVLPINLPILAVWIRNLAVHWLTPFSSHHNVWSIMPFVVLVESLTSGRMIPRVASPLRYVTSLILTGTALYSAVFGVSYAYRLHHLINIASAWIVVVHSTIGPRSFSSGCGWDHGAVKTDEKP